MVMRVSSTARSNLSGLALNPGAKPSIRNGMVISARTVSAKMTNTSPASASSAKARAASLPSPSSFLANSGTKAELNAPSPNRRRNKLGNRKATKKASATAPEHGEAADGGEGAVEFHRGAGVAERLG